MGLGDMLPGAEQSAPLRLQAGDGGPHPGLLDAPGAVSRSPLLGGPGPGKQGLREQVLGRHSFPGEPLGCPSVASGPGWGSQGAQSGAASARGWWGAAAALDTLRSSRLVGVRHP